VKAVKEARWLGKPSEAGKILFFERLVPNLFLVGGDNGMAD
jgi:hypothetical protein